MTRSATPRTDELCFDVAVFGGGIIGASIAGALVELGMTVILIERGCIGSQGASRYSGGIVRLYDPDEAIEALAAYSLARMANTAVGRAFGACITRTGVCYAAAQMPSAEDVKSRRHDGLTDYPLEVVPKKSLPQAIGDNSSGEDVVLWEAAGGHGDVRASARMVVQEVRRRGLVLENACIKGMDTSRDQAAIRFDAVSIRAQSVVLAVGAWISELLPQLRLFARSVPMVRFRAHHGLVAPVIDEAAASYMLPLSRDAVQVGSRVRTAAAHPQALAYEHVAITADASERLHRMIGAPLDAQAIDVVPGFDSYTEDGRPCLGHLCDANVFVAAGFCGIGYKLAIGVAWLIALQIADRLGRSRLHPREAKLLAPFDPSRFGPSGSLRATGGDHAQ